MNGQSIIEEVRGRLEVSGLFNLSGGYYMSGMRPFNSNREDCVVSMNSGLDGQIQEGYLTVNVYVPDIPYSDGQYHCNTVRVGDIAAQMEQIPDVLNETSDVWFQPYAMVLTFPHWLHRSTAQKVRSCKLSTMLRHRFAT